MNIIIWGLGVSGISALRYLVKNSEHNIYVVNSGELGNWPQGESIFSLVGKDNCFSQDEVDPNMEVDQIILSPGVPRYLPELESFLSRGVEVISDVELAFRSIKVPVIAITGTNGKTTTTTMISKALENCGLKVFTGGNIGIPACDYFLDQNYDYCVLELSSFQLESLDTFRANIAIILNITENHMERYDEFDSYKNAKLNIVMNQREGDLFIAPASFLPTETSATKLCLLPLLDYSFEHSKVLGSHNRENFFCVEAVLNYFGIMDYKEKTQDLIDNFSGVEFRLEFIRSLGDVDFYNDAKSTNSASTIAAIRACSAKNVYLILGGKVRDLNQDLKKDFKGEKISKIFAFGEAAKMIKRDLGPFFEVIECDTLKEVMDKKHFVNLKGCVLLSPGFPSFDQYKNYTERGRDFNQLVHLM